MSLLQFLFFYQAAAIVVLSLLIVTRQSPVHSVLLMLGLFFHIAGLFLFLNAEFMAAIQIIVYAGAILVLFLFVVFLLNLKADALAQKSVTNWPTGAVIAAALFVITAVSTSTLTPGTMGPWSIAAIKQTTHIKAIGMELYTKYIFPFEIASLILLVAILGAITLAKKQKEA